MYSRFLAGDDVVLRQSGPEPVKERGKNQQYIVHIHMQHISIFTLTMVSRCIKHLLKVYLQVSIHSFDLEKAASVLPFSSMWLVSQCGTWKERKYALVNLISPAFHFHLFYLMKPFCLVISFVI